MNNTGCWRTPLYLLACLSLSLVSGCATIVKGTTQSVTVSTDPAGANCALSRDGAQIAVVNPTPGTVTVEKARGTIALACKKLGYQDSAGVLASTFQAMTFGNILFGGIIGVAVDAGSGAMNEYPPMVTITMVPEEFGSIAERDAFFDRLRASFVTEAAEVKERIKSKCSSDCDAQLKAADDGVAEKLAQIETRRQAARVRASNT